VPLAYKEKEVNPIWTKMIVDAVENTTKTCPHCKKVATYTRKRPGQFHKCKSCGHRFKEKG
jgi:transposase